MTQWNVLLKSLGFTDSEAKIYLISLEMGPSSVQDIARKAKVSRVTTYAVIESLAERGLMSQVQKGKKTNYTAESPERLISFVQSRMKEMESTLKEVETGIQDLRLLQRGEKPVVKLFEGEEGVKAIAGDIASSDCDVIYEIANIEAVKNIFPDWVGLKELREELNRKKVKTKGIYLSKPEFTIRPFTDAHLLPQGYDFSGDIAVYGNKIAMYTFKGKLISVLIESAELAQTLRELMRLGMTGKNLTEKKGPQA